MYDISTVNHKYGKKININSVLSQVLQCRIECGLKEQLNCTLCLLFAAAVIVHFPAHLENLISKSIKDPFPKVYLLLASCHNMMVFVKRQFSNIKIDFLRGLQEVFLSQLEIFTVKLMFIGLLANVYEGIAMVCRPSLCTIKYACSFVF